MKKQKIDFESYFKEIKEKAEVAFAIAEEARKRGLDPVKKVEIKIASSLIEKTTGIVSILYPQVKDKKIEERIRELEKEYGFLDPTVALKIAEEIAMQKYCKFSSQLEAIDAGIRLGFAYLTLGVVSSPIEGFVKLEVRKTHTNREYLAAFFSGPIRSAGGTAAALSLILIDYMRKLFKYEKYDATEEEIKRAITEINDYHEFITNLQYLPNEKEIEIIAREIPIQIEGDASEEREVSNYKDLSRISTNKIRSGFCLVLAEGIAAKAAKIIKVLKRLQEVGIDLYRDWKFLEKLEKAKTQAKTRTEIQTESKIESKEIEMDKFDEYNKSDNKSAPSYTYIKDIVAGRPILSYPSMNGGFRLRYGRTRTSGYSAMAVNPALTYILENFLAIGTQLRTERPGKSCSLATCTTIEGPIIKFNDGSVVKIDNNIEKYKNKISEIKEIIYLGDLLVSFGDFYNRNHVLMPAGYVEEWWYSELIETLQNIIANSDNYEKVKRAEELMNELKDYFNVSLKKAIEISLEYGVPLYPKYIFYFSQIDVVQFLELVSWVKKGYFNQSLNFVLPYSKNERQKEKIANAKRALELLGVEHYVSFDNVLIKKDEAIALLINIGVLKGEEIKKFSENEKNILQIDFKNVIEKIEREVVEIVNEKNKNSTESKLLEKPLLDLINRFCEFRIRDKAGTFIGARMGRPEKAKPKVMTGHPNVLFPVGDEGGRFRSFNEALDKGYIEAEFPTFFCENCKRETVFFVCEECNNETIYRYFCDKCDKLYQNNVCHQHSILKPFRKKKIDIKYYIEKTLNLLNFSKNENPKMIKGVHGTSSKEHICEHLAKGILRAKYGLSVYKDGTLRYDATELPITHFKPKEIGTSIEKLRVLGYTRDINGDPLENEDQLLLLMPHDMILPSSSESMDETADNFFIKVANFVDELLERFYKMKPFFCVKNKEDLIGHLILCIAPHNTGGTVARIIGFSNTQTFLASPYLHAAMRRDCDGDEAGFMLLLDALINFSVKYIPFHRGGTQDTPLIANIRIKQNEVDDMLFDMENVSLFPVEFYYATLQYKNPREIKIRQIRNDLDNTFSFIFSFTHPTSYFDLGNKCSAYKKLVTMEEKLQKQVEVGEKIRAVNVSDLATLIITKHFLRDIRGNLRKFSMQQFRCSKCNTKYRRPPLQGNCINSIGNMKCNGRIIFTITEGGIKKYLGLALDLAKKYNVKDYIKQTLELTKASIDLIFGKEEGQETLQKFFS